MIRTEPNITFLSVISCIIRLKVADTFVRWCSIEVVFATISRDNNRFFFSLKNQKMTTWQGAPGTGFYPGQQGLDLFFYVLNIFYR